MAIPQLDLPIYLQQKGKKNLSPKVIAELDSAIEKLQRIKGEHQVVAWSHIASIYAYQNCFNKAIEYFKKIYETSGSVDDLNNIIVALERKGECLLAIVKLLEYLQIKVDKYLLSFLLGLLLKYPVKQYVEQCNHILIQLNYEEYQEHHKMFDIVLARVQQLDKIGLSIEHYTLMTNILVKLISSFYYKLYVKTNWNVSQEQNSLFQTIHIFEAEAEDILELNQLYEQEIEKLIGQGRLTIEDYIEIISKYNFSFVIHSETYEEWEKSCASS